MNPELLSKQSREGLAVGRRILLVEDEEIILAAVTRQLRRSGFDVVATANSGKAAIEATAAKDPDLILMDLRLQGGMNGMEAAQKIRQTSAVPILFVTAHAHRLANTLHDLPGNNRVISKPFSANELCVAIEAMLSA
jgi:DNA-binding response OmpR family regulator